MAQTPPSISLPRRSSRPSLLAQFLPGKIAHKMDRKNSLELRKKAPISYAESNGSISPETSPQNQRVIDLTDSFEDDASTTKEEEDDEDFIEYAVAKRGLRSGRNMSVKARENALSLGARSKGRRKISLAEYNFAPSVSERVAIRQEIANKTTAYRNQCLLEQKDLWLPLLPLDHNYIKTLIAKNAELSPEEIASLPKTTPYKEIEEQPRGIRATMKPYQLSGLSFMLYLYHNGLSGILGDEMGLGKTLQTLSLIQYLKENDPKRGEGRLQRPFLIICPLSVLSSWMNEAKKWTPGLKAIRFHGPADERTRAKKIIVGEIDAYGRMTAQAKSKMKSRQTAKSKSRPSAKAKESISLDTDSEDEHDVGVDLVVTTYESFKSEQSWFKKAFVWRYVVLDEGHTIKNSASQVSTSLQGIKAEYRLILTGTPLQNNLYELWSLIHWLYPEVFIENTRELFDKAFNLSKGGHFSKDVVDNSRKFLELIMLRRMKNSPGVELNLPPKTEVLLFAPLSPMQRFWYKRIITKSDKGLLDEIFKGAKGKEVEALRNEREEDDEEKRLEMQAAALQNLEGQAIGSDVWKETKEILEKTVKNAIATQGNNEWKKLMNLLMQLRKVCNHPYTIANAEPDPYFLGEHVINASGKFIVLEKLVTELVLKQKKKILIFSGFTKTLDLVEELLTLRGGNGTSFQYTRLDGSIERARRNLAIRLFNDLESDYRVMLISTRAGGLGINLATASDVVLLDQDWNPQITLQAEARAHRIGQKNPVTIYKLVSQGTVEEQMMGRIQKKLYLSAKVTETMEDIHTKFGTSKKKASAGMDEDLPQLDRGTLMTMVRRGASAITKAEIDVNEMLSWDWATTVAKCKDQPADIIVKKDAIRDSKVDEEAERKWFSEMERVESALFDGENLASAKAKSNKASAWDFFASENLHKEDRRVGKNTTVMVDGYAISKESMNCEEWEAVPTMAGKDPRLADPIRPKKDAIEHQSHCQVCLDGGELQCCSNCPRSFHYGCLDKEFQAKSLTWKFTCPQHKCFDCQQSTADAGGMLYRCRWCERAYCEDCIDFDKTILIGNNLMEYEMLGYPEFKSAFFIQCHECSDHFEDNPADRKMCQDMAEGIRLAYDDKFMREPSTMMDSMTDAATVETSGVNTPILIEDSDEFSMVGKTKKRKSKGEGRSHHKKRKTITV